VNRHDRIVLVVVLVVVLGFVSPFEDLPSLGFGKAGEDDDEVEDDIFSRG
jgi:hypothetical protein